MAGPNLGIAKKRRRVLAASRAVPERNVGVLIGAEAFDHPSAIFPA
jgi:hypothetical protein